MEVGYQDDPGTTGGVDQSGDAVEVGRPEAGERSGARGRVSKDHCEFRFMPIQIQSMALRKEIGATQKSRMRPKSGSTSENAVKTDHNGIKKASESQRSTLKKADI